MRCGAHYQCHGGKKSVIGQVNERVKNKFRVNFCVKIDYRFFTANLTIK